jgi:ABC-type microcin C transport system duplicated ATPase subunit YejF
MRTVRGKDIAMIFQEPMTSLNPSTRSATRSPRRHAAPAVGTREAYEIAEQSLRDVGIADPAGGCTNTRTRCPAACASAS